jgi:hypothetical protein
LFPDYVLLFYTFIVCLGGFMKYEKILANGYWLDNKEKFSQMVVARGVWDGIEDAEDESIFFYLDDKEPIGIHNELVITDYESI